MSKKIKLPNGQNYEVQENEEKYLHVFITHKHGVELSSPYVGKFHPRTWNQRDEKNSIIAGQVVWDESIAKKAEEAEAKAQAKKDAEQQTKKSDEKAGKTG